MCDDRDTTVDIWQARQPARRQLAVMRVWYEKELRKAGADEVLRDLRELKELFEIKTKRSYYI
jgi:hypothetical protein